MSKLEDSTNDSIRVLRQGTCPSLSRKSKITFHVGADTDDEIHVRIHASSGNGIFSDEWISAKDIQAVLNEHPEGTPITSFILYPLFKGRSVNTPAFLLAALAHEKLLYPMQDKKRGLQVVDSDEFTAKLEKLMSSSKVSKKKVTTKRSTKKAVTKKTVTRKAAIKKKAASRRKSA